MLQCNTSIARINRTSFHSSTQHHRTTHRRLLDQLHEPIDSIQNTRTECRNFIGHIQYASVDISWSTDWPQNAREPSRSVLARTVDTHQIDDTHKSLHPLSTVESEQNCRMEYCRSHLVRWPIRSIGNTENPVARFEGNFQRIHRLQTVTVEWAAITFGYTTAKRYAMGIFVAGEDYLATLGKKLMRGFWIRICELNAPHGWIQTMRILIQIARIR